MDQVLQLIKQEKKRQQESLIKRVRQTAPSILPNETETVIMVTGNARAWRHIISMRASDHKEEKLPDGTWCVKTEYPKV